MRTRIYRGFTLVELLAVIGIIAVMTGVLGLALRDGGPPAALQSAQGTIASLVAAARAQAAVSQNRTMLVVNADPTDEHFLRDLAIAVETAPNSGQWRVATDGALLPRGIYIVPGSGSAAGTVLTGGDAGTGAWPAGRRSSLAPVPAETIAPTPESPAGVFLGLTSLFTAQGTVDHAGGGRLVLAAARPTATGVVFDHPERVRGVVLSAYGVAVLVNDGPGFDF